MSEEALAEGLRQMGYQLRPHEMRMLAEQVDPQSHSGAISKSAFLASQLDWHHEDLRYAPDHMMDEFKVLSQIFGYLQWHCCTAFSSLSHSFALYDSGPMTTTELFDLTGMVLISISKTQQITDK